MHVFFLKVGLNALIFSTVLLGGCKQNNKKESGNFGEFLSAEIIAFEGKTNSLDEVQLHGQWTVRRDQLGAAIDTAGISFTDITNILTQEFGSPRFYSPANERHGPTYVYPPSIAGVAVFVSSTTSGSEVTLTRLPRELSK